MKRYKKKSLRTGRYKSRLEARVAKELGRKAKYEVDKLDYIVPAKHRKYSPDFTIIKTGNKIFIEVKGFLRYEDQAKMRWVKECNPDADIRFYFPYDNKVHLSKLKNSEWCAKHGFPCYIGVLPKDM